MDVRTRQISPGLREGHVLRDLPHGCVVFLLYQPGVKSSPLSFVPREIRRSGLDRLPRHHGRRPPAGSWRRVSALSTDLTGRVLQAISGEVCRASLVKEWR